eukprot:Gb_39997 [translate_table: standard]
MEKLSKCPANYVPLSPLTFLERAAVVYAQRTSIIYEGFTFTWAETMERCRRVASSLISRFQMRRGDVVSVLAPNVPALYEMHFAVPMAGAVLNTINMRLDANNVATILAHSHAKLLFVDYQFLPLAKDALAILSSRQTAPMPTNMPLLLLIDEPWKLSDGSTELLQYEDLVRAGDPRFESLKPEDEWESITLNYTSGTTSAPKGVVYSHRGAYLSTLSALLLWEMGTEPVFLWSLPMFHCNGWTFTWGVAARGGTNVCIRNLCAGEMFGAISKHRVSHFCCAPIIFNIILNAKPHERQPLSRTVHILTGGAPPPPSMVSKMEEMGFCITHAYGLTEATGPALVCEWKDEWDQLDAAQRGRMKGRQGVSVVSLDQVDVKDPLTMASVAKDGHTMGEVMVKGSSLMKGYLHDQQSTDQAFAGGWFHTGDVGVIHPDGYVEIKDRSKDVIISGGENISSVEVESVLYSHPLVTEAAVVAMPDAHWGETPCAFVNVANISEMKEKEIVSFCRERLPHYMVPKTVVFMELPKTSTGKIQKFLLRDMAKKLSKTPTHAPAKLSRKTTAPAKQQHHQHLDRDPHQNYIVARSRL